MTFIEFEKAVYTTFNSEKMIENDYNSIILYFAYEYFVNLLALIREFISIFIY